MKLSLLFRLIFLVVLFGSTLAGCIPATEGTVDLSQNGGDIHALSLAMQSNPTGNVTAQFRVVPYTPDTVFFKLYCVNHNTYPVTVTVQDGITLDIYNAAGRLVETVKNQYSGEKGTYKVVIAPGQSIEVDTFTVTKSDEEPRLAYSEFNFTLEGSEKSKLQAVTAIF